jgi:hypothetical protein
MVQSAFVDHSGWSTNGSALASRSITPEIPNRPATPRPSTTTPRKPTAKPEPALPTKSGATSGGGSQWMYRGIVVDPIIFCANRRTEQKAQFAYCGTLAYRGVEYDLASLKKAPDKTQMARGNLVTQLMYRGISVQDPSEQNDGSAPRRRRFVGQ